jgi:mannose-1-phosphate guanylyltransferase/mannose-6-phosphate isomerase
MVRHVVILAGGSGTRLWPASRASFPKQFLAFEGETSLFQKTILRAQSLVMGGMVIVVTHQSQVQQILHQWKKLPAVSNTQRRVILPEPEARNTAPALVYAAAFLKSAGQENTSFLVLASDHLIEPMGHFKKDVENAFELASRGTLVTFGIPPSRPETGYGYIEVGERRPPGFDVKNFHEKPDLQTAEKYIKSGKFYWNSGMFTYPVGLFLDEMNRNSPQITGEFSKISLELKRSDTVSIPKDMASVKTVYRNLPSISIDYALMEKSRIVTLVKATFDWSDVGSWDEVSQHFKNQPAKIFEVEGGENFVYSDIPVTLAGVQDLIVVIKDGIALVCKKGSSQLVKEVVSGLRENGRNDIL